MRWLPAVPLVPAVAVAAWGFASGQPSSADASRDAPQQEEQLELGAALYRTYCVACHGVDGRGVEDRGPSLQEEGAAAADFVLRTGRMPMADVDMQPVEKPTPLDEEEIQALVAYVALLGDGPGIPDVDPARGSLAEGSALYQLNCAACHVASGAGAVIGRGREAPPLMDVTATQVGEAVLVGPGAMPVFGELDEDDLDDLAAYILHLQEEDTTGVDALGGVGPVAEGLAAWLIGLIPLVALTRWIGRPDDARDEPDQLDGDDRPARVDVDVDVDVDGVTGA